MPGAVWLVQKLPARGTRSLAEHLIQMSGIDAGSTMCEFDLAPVLERSEAAQRLRQKEHTSPLQDKLWNDNDAFIACPQPLCIRSETPSMVCCTMQMFARRVALHQSKGAKTSLISSSCIAYWHAHASMIDLGNRHDVAAGHSARDRSVCICDAHRVLTCRCCQVFELRLGDVNIKGTLGGGKILSCTRTRLPYFVSAGLLPPFRNATLPDSRRPRDCDCYDW